MIVDGAGGHVPVLSKREDGTVVRDENAEIRALSEDFESLFLGIVLKAMRDTVPKNGLIDGGNAEEIYRSMLDAEYAKSMAQQRGTGLADNIEEFLQRAKKSQDEVQGAASKLMGLKAYGPTALPRPANPATMGGGPAAARDASAILEKITSGISLGPPRPL